jgi:hypothetical protein
VLAQGKVEKVVGQAKVEKVAGQTKVEKVVKETITRGEVIDILTYVKTGKYGESNKNIMTESAKAGNPLGILSSGKIYFVFTIDPNAKTNDQMLPYLAKKVVVIGQVYSKGGANIILMSNIDTDKKAK